MKEHKLIDWKEEIDPIIISNKGGLITNWGFLKLTPREGYTPKFICNNFEIEFDKDKLNSLLQKQAQASYREGVEDCIKELELATPKVGTDNPEWKTIVLVNAIQNLKSLIKEQDE